MKDADQTKSKNLHKLIKLNFTAIMLMKITPYNLSPHKHKLKI